MLHLRLHSTGPVRLRGKHRAQSGNRAITGQGRTRRPWDHNDRTPFLPIRAVVRWVILRSHDKQFGQLGKLVTRQRTSPVYRRPFIWLRWAASISAPVAASAGPEKPENVGMSAGRDRLPAARCDSSARNDMSGRGLQSAGGQQPDRRPTGAVDDRCGFQSRPARSQVNS